MEKALYVVCIQNLIRRHVIMSSCHHAVKDSLILKAVINTEHRTNHRNTIRLNHTLISFFC